MNLVGKTDSKSITERECLLRVLVLFQLLVFNCTCNEFINIEINALLKIKVHSSLQYTTVLIIRILFFSKNFAQLQLANYPTSLFSKIFAEKYNLNIQTCKKKVKIKISYICIKNCFIYIITKYLLINLPCLFIDLHTSFRNNYSHYFCVVARNCFFLFPCLYYNRLLL